jgi:hypothetical protein
MDPEIPGLRFQRKLVDAQQLPTQTSLETASQPLSLGAAFHRNYQLTGMEPLQLPTANPPDSIEDRATFLVILFWTWFLREFVLQNGFIIIFYR